MPFEWSSSRSAFEAYTIAKQMEKEQKKESFVNGWESSGEAWGVYMSFEHYYKTNFEK
jgi:hypothetical protein